jgi:hypothetical protein
MGGNPGQREGIPPALRDRLDRFREQMQDRRGRQGPMPPDVRRDARRPEGPPEVERLLGELRGLLREMRDRLPAPPPGKPGVRRDRPPEGEREIGKGKAREREGAREKKGGDKRVEKKGEEKRRGREKDEDNDDDREEQ